jgi:hypothetical protein
MGVPDETFLFAVIIFSCRFEARGGYYRSVAKRRPLFPMDSGGE